MRRYSQIWNFFELNAETPNRADCKLCGAKVSRGGRRASDYTTTNLISHLWLHHKVAYQEYRKRQKVHTAHVTSSTHPHHHHAIIGAIAGGGVIIGDPVGSSGSSGSAGSADDFPAPKRWCVEAGEEAPPVLVGVPSGAGAPVGAGGAAGGSGAVDYFSASPSVPSAVVAAAANGSEGGPHDGLVEMKFCINEVQGNVSNVSMEIPLQFQHHLQHPQHHQQQQQRPQLNHQPQVRGHTRGRPTASPRTSSTSAPAFAPFCAMRVVPLDCKMVEMVAQDGRPLSCVRDAGFRRLLAHLSPGYRPGSPTLLAERVVPDVLAALRARLLCLLGGARSVALSARTLRAGDGEPWLLTAAHWRCRRVAGGGSGQQQQQQRRRQGCRRRALVRCAPTDFAPPRATAVAKELQKVIFWGVRRVSVLLVCGGGGDFTDDAEAVGSAEELAREASTLAALPAAPCASHLLRVAVARGALALAATERLLLVLRGRRAGRGDADSRRQPPPAGARATGLAGGWTSAYRLLRSASARRHKQGGAGGATGTNWTSLRLSASQERLLQLLALLLRPVAEVARELARPDATLGAAIPLLRVLLRSLAAAARASSGERRTPAADDARGSGGGGAVDEEEEDEEEEEDDEGLRAGLLAPLGRALEALESCRCSALATVLDPRFKCAFFSSDGAAARARAWLLEDAGVGGGDDDDNRDDDERGGAGHGGAARGGAGASGSSEIWSRFEEVIAEHRPAGARLSPAEEVTVYLLEPPVERTRCPHAWWGAGDGAEDTAGTATGAVSAGGDGDCGGGGSRFPRLGRLARRLLAAPPTCGCGDGDGEEDDGGSVGDCGDGGGDGGDGGDCVWGQRVPRSWHGELGAALLVIRHGLPAVDYAY
uniref:Uncharacterized protein LOC116956378 n=1 Tax=Petromyzon marinus TaxID=7757 RepID=A0AAJ7UDN2_PETMA|nr:uncharacterized protein LOC116956378 [Petromyzon marinus]XP_032833848.1 uncharacterized protein LOC116956378 [Petromyzon marinus]XP_032833849.1 uncharacterized protein LOC116956378 [Petromyzon marinus]XP_032833850.1 uncharacterized protein LOC116956378 [Petromyzon marinus]